MILILGKINFFQKLILSLYVLHQTIQLSFETFLIKIISFLNGYTSSPGHPVYVYHV